MIDAAIPMGTNTQVVIAFFGSCVTLYVIIIALLTYISGVKERYVLTASTKVPIKVFLLLFLLIFIILLFIQETFIDVNIAARILFISAIGILTYFIIRQID